MDGISRQDFTFFHPLRVRWSEVDPQGIVFNPNYLAYADIALTEYMRADRLSLSGRASAARLRSFRGARRDQFPCLRQI